jgi:hypothetical protein
VAQSRFGGEEWLFNFAWLIDGFHYAFLQPVSKSFDNVTGKIIELLLYTINSKDSTLEGSHSARCLRSSWQSVRKKPIKSAAG